MADHSPPVASSAAGEKTSWLAAAPCPLPLYDAGGARIGHLLYVFNGYRTMDVVNEKVLVFDLEQDKWIGAITPKVRIAHSHVAVATDGRRYIYAASGQYGPQCWPAIADCASFDSHSGNWRLLPPLPEARYAGAMHLLGDRLHYVGGARPDRYTPAVDHWSISVAHGEATESQWREETPVPVGGMHRGSIAIEGSLYLFGGQQGDFRPIPNDPAYVCTGRTREVYSALSFRFTPGMQRWVRLRDMPIPASHTDFSTLWDGQEVHLIGGQIYKNPGTFRLRLTSAIQAYDVARDRWRISGRLPYRLKIPVCALYNGVVTVTTGQRDQGPRDDSPGQVTAATFRTRIELLRTRTSAPDSQSAYSALRDKRVVLISHDLSLTGAPLLLVETAREMQKAGAIVRLFTLADDAHDGNPAEAAGIPVLPVETSLAWAQRADLVIANTAVTGKWVSKFLELWPQAGEKLVWWIHENDTEIFARLMESAARARAIVIDSRAALEKWEESGVQLAQRRFVVHPANDWKVFAAAETQRLPAPLASSGALITRNEFRSRMGFREDEFVLLCIGTFHPNKGQMELLQTVGQLIEANPGLPLSLVLVGFASREQARKVYEGLPESARSAVKDGLLMIKSQREISLFYRAADAFVMNSQGSGEVFGRVTIEAMAFGLPILGTDAGGTREIVVDGETGLLHPLGAAGRPVLARNIMRLVNDRKFARQLGEAGRVRARTHFSPDRFHREFAAAITA